MVNKMYFRLLEFIEFFWFVEQFSGMDEALMGYKIINLSCYNDNPYGREHNNTAVVAVGA